MDELDGRWRPIKRARCDGPSPPPQSETAVARGEPPDAASGGGGRAARWAKRTHGKALLYGEGDDTPGAKRPTSAEGPTALAVVVAAARMASLEEAAAMAKLEPHNPARDVDDSATRVGLDNPNSLCHLNALVQCLFTDVGFRRGIYGHADGTLVNSSVAAFEADVEGGCGQPAAKALAAAATAADSIGSTSPKAVKVARQLCLLFANLQHSAYRSYDPMALATLLDIDPEVQQDPHETRNTLLDRLSEDTALGAFIRARFGGTCFYRLACRDCQKAAEVSSKSHVFLALDLTVGSTLEQALRKYVSVQEIECRCAQCTCAVGVQHIEIRELPPVLNLQFKRYRFAKSGTTPTKLESAITFPEILDESSFVTDAASAGSSTQAGRPRRWRLTAVVMHSGATCSSGHYTARLLDQSRADECWLTANDELVEEKAYAEAADKPRATGVTLLTKSCARTGGRLFASKQVHVLVYTREDEIARARAMHEQVVAPRAVQEEVRAGDETKGAAYRVDFDSYQEAWRKFSVGHAERRCLLDELVPILGTAEGQDGRWIGSAWLQSCLTLGARVGAGEPGPIDNAPLLCRHGGGAADPEHARAGAMKLISLEAWQRLRACFNGGPELQAPTCVECARSE